METEIQKDAKLIDSLGGPAEVAKLLGFRSESGAQRVNNWKTRGIPARVKIERPDLFLGYLKQEAA